MQDTKSTFLGGFYLIAPAIAMFVLFHPSVGFVPAQLLSNGDPMAPWAAGIVGLVPGYVLYKRAVTIRGHEWHRLQAIKKLSKHYKNEGSEAWNDDGNITLRTTKGSVEVGNLTQNALEKMQGRIGDLMMDNMDARAEIDTKGDIQFLADKEHVNLAASRMRGDASLEDKTNKVTFADKEKKSLMDNVLDWFALKLSKKNSESIIRQDKSSNVNLSSVQNNFENLSSGASDYEKSVSNSWHCRSCSNMNSITSIYCEMCGSSK